MPVRSGRSPELSRDPKAQMSDAARLSSRYTPGRATTFVRRAAKLMAPRILVLSASVGAGHLRAAQAVELALRARPRRRRPQRRRAGAHQRRRSASSTARRTSTWSTRPRTCWATSTTCMDQPAPAASARATGCGCCVGEAQPPASSSDLLEDEPWDLVVNTHFLPAEIIASLRRAGRARRCRR